MVSIALRNFATGSNMSGWYWKSAMPKVKTLGIKAYNYIFLCVCALTPEPRCLRYDSNGFHGILPNCTVSRSHILSFPLPLHNLEHDIACWDHLSRYGMGVRIIWAEAQFQERFDAVPSGRAAERRFYRMLAAKMLYCERCGGVPDIAWVFDRIEVRCGERTFWGCGWSRSRLRMGQI